MESGNSTVLAKCFPTAVGVFGITLLCAILPFHILLVKVLVFDLHLVLARHKITLCLSISDAVQLLVAVLRVTVVIIFSSAKNYFGCDIVQGMILFTVAMTLAISSLSIIALSVERYVACIYSFHLHRVFTRKRMIYGTSFVWILGLVCGVLAVIPSLLGWNGESQRAGQFIKTIVVTFIIPTSAIISVIQHRLLVFSRKKLAQVGPGKQFGCEAEIADFRKKQIKMALVASIVAIAYIACMLPLGCLSFYELIYGNILSSRIPVALQALAFVNNFVDPYIYGIGIADTRRAVCKNLRKLKALFLRKV